MKNLCLYAPPCTVILSYIKLQFPYRKINHNHLHITIIIVHFHYIASQSCQFSQKKTPNSIPHQNSDNIFLTQI